MTDLKDGFRVGNWLVRPLQGVIEQGGHRVHVEPKVMDVLLCLARHPGQVVSREMLLDEVWAGVVVTDEVVTRCISELRTVLRDTGRDRQFIRTIPKRGYSLLVPVEPLGVERAVPDEPDPQPPVTEATPEAADSSPPPALALLSATARGTMTAGRQALATARRLFRSALLGIGLFVVSIVALGLLIALLSSDDGRVDIKVMPNDDAGGPASAPTPPPAPNPGAFRSLAVLPLVTLGDSGETGFFSEGLTEDIRNALINGTGLQVATRASTADAQDGSTDGREIARELKVDALLEGTVRMADDQLRVTIQLIDGRTGYPVWASSFERPAAEKATLQAEVPKAILRQFQPAATGRKEPGRKPG